MFKIESEKPTIQYSFWIDETYMNNLDTTIDRFSHLCIHAEESEARRKYQEITKELLAHKVKLLQILQLRDWNKK